MPVTPSLRGKRGALIHQTRKPFYTTRRREKYPELRGNYAYELYQVMMLRLLSGSDLLRLNGQLWSRPLHFLPKYYLPLYEKLREEGFVPDDLDSALSTLPSKMLNCRSLFLYTLSGPFIVQFSDILSSCFSVITEKDIRRLSFFRTLVDSRKLHNVPPYTGDIQTSITFSC